MSKQSQLSLDQSPCFGGSRTPHASVMTSYRVIELSLSSDSISEARRGASECRDISITIDAPNTSCREEVKGEKRMREKNRRQDQDKEWRERDESKGTGGGQRRITSLISIFPNTDVQVLLLFDPPVRSQGISPTVCVLRDVERAILAESNSTWAGKASIRTMTLKNSDTEK